MKNKTEPKSLKICQRTTSLNITSGNQYFYFSFFSSSVFEKIKLKKILNKQTTKNKIKYKVYLKQ